MAELLKRLCEAHSVSGNETEVRELITELVKDKCSEVNIDTMGNIIAFKKGRKSGKKIAAAANMDETGLIISSVTDNGYLKFKQVGDVDPRKLVSKKVKIGRDKTAGVIGMKAIHLQSPDERENVVKVKDLYIDIGAKDRDDALKRVRIGDYASFATEFMRIGDTVKGKALDRSAPCYALIKALDADYPYDFYACFSAQHEVGARGAKIMAHRLAPDAALVISTSETSDIYGYENKSSGLRLGLGAAVSFADKGFAADRELTRRMLEAARENNITVQQVVGMTAAADGYAFQITDTRVLSLVIPCRYSRSPVSLADLRDIEGARQYIKLFLNKIGDMI